ncbi:MAG TPA: MBL fold metallo-hydrolase [Acidobacteriota bacterium]|nr:MBL fold metallo-hydrolase [Acidobacteriota bacterium]
MLDGLRVTFLGTGTSAGIPVITCDCDVCVSTEARNSRLRASLLLEWAAADGNVVKVLVDTSTDLRQQALRASINRVDAVMYTHAHADHVLGLDELRIFNFVYRQPIPLYGASETLTALQRMFKYAFDPHAVAGPRLTPIEIRDRFELFGLTVEAIALPHGPGTVRAFRIGDFAYATDCSEIPAAAEARLRGLDVLVIDALRRKPHRSHFTVEQALEQVARLQPRQAYLTHMSHDLEHAATQASLPDGVAVAYDELMIEMSLPEGSRCA